MVSSVGYKISDERSRFTLSFTLSTSSTEQQGRKSGSPLYIHHSHPRAPQQSLAGAFFLYIPGSPAEENRNSRRTTIQVLHEMICFDDLMSPDHSHGTT
nr:hypothetical protein CFP56_79046 [Quercus suber]